MTEVNDYDAYPGVIAAKHPGLDKRTPFLFHHLLTSAPMMTTQTLTPHDLVLQAKAQIKEISTANAQPLLAQHVIIDVREPDEFAQGHLPGAINVPRGVLEFRMGTLPVVKNPAQAILLYCGSGGRSALAAVQLQKIGYSQVVSMTGGFDAWAAESRPSEKPAPVSYD